jgi:hypothetical protein
MKTESNARSAAVLVFAVLLLAAGVFVLAGIAQLAATQALVGQNEWEGLNRRIKLENSRAMGRQFMLTRMFNGVVSTNTGYTNATLGGFSLSPVSETSAGSDYWTTLSTTNTNVNLKINPFTLMERGGFYRVVVPGTIYDGVENVPWNFQVRTRSPIAAGYPLTQHRPASNTVSGFLNPPYIDMNDPEQFVGFHEMARMRVTSVTNTNIDPTGYEGYLDVPAGVAAYGLYTNVQFVPENPAASGLWAVIALSNADPDDLSQVLVYTLENVAEYVTSGVTNNVPVTGLILQGTVSGLEMFDLKPLQIRIPRTQTNLTTIVLEGRNPYVTGRPVYINCQRPISRRLLNLSAADALGKWRLGLTVQFSPTNGVVSFANTAGIQIVGGIRTDGVITGSPVLEQELDPGGLDYVADRMMWLEDYKTP